MSKQLTQSNQIIVIYCNQRHNRALYTEPRVRVESGWSPPTLQAESRWSPSGVQEEFRQSLGGVHEESRRSPSGVHPEATLTDLVSDLGLKAPKQNGLFRV